MFRRRPEDHGSQGGKPTHGRYYLQHIGTRDPRSNLDKHLTAIQAALDAGAAQGWALVQSELNYNAPAVLLWDTQPS